ncbi:MAG: FAD-dependent oxidoreductase [Eubacteriales bacterium]|nr:FAD-dependent oxidoreductase [Eubacteriales bacterium]
MLIIGGGLVGILCAYKLQEAGIDYILAEAKHIGSGVTGVTTAKITAQHGLIYDKLIKSFGIEKARKYYDANMKAYKEYERLSDLFEFDFEKKTAYTYSTANRQKLEAEAKAYDKLSIMPLFSESAPLPLKIVGAIGMKDQAQFNPLKFLYGISSGLNIYENAFVSKIEGNTAYVEKGSVTAKHIILATHFPFINIPGLYFLKMYQNRSYVIALDNGPQLDGMYVDEREDGHSFRNYKNLLFIGGGDHKTGKTGGQYDELRKLARKAYPHCTEKYAWSAQDCMTLDDIPYIGVLTKSRPNIYVATGFKKWGMTSSMVAADILFDLINHKKSDYEDLFSPQRSILRPQLAVNGVNAVINLIKPGKRCSHMGCALKWNKAEQSWDCPCHGSRFDNHGAIINNPAKRSISVE